jgi:hypothetical protein
MSCADYAQLLKTVMFSTYVSGVPVYQDLAFCACRIED